MGRSVYYFASTSFAIVLSIVWVDQVAAQIDPSCKGCNDPPCLPITCANGVCIDAPAPDLTLIIPGSAPYCSDVTSTALAFDSDTDKYDGSAGVVVELCGTGCPVEWSIKPPGGGWEGAGGGTQMTFCAGRVGGYTVKAEFYPPIFRCDECAGCTGIEKTESAGGVEVSCPNWQLVADKNLISQCETANVMVVGPELLGCSDPNGVCEGLIVIEPDLQPASEGASGSPILVGGTIYPNGACGSFTVKSRRIPDEGGVECPVVSVTVTIECAGEETGQPSPSGSGGGGGGGRGGFVAAGGSGCDSCGSQATAGGGNAALDSVSVQLSMGMADDEDSAGVLYVHSDRPTSTLGTRAALKYPVSVTGVDTIRDATTGDIVQVLSAEVLAQTKEIDSTSWQVSFWTLDVIGSPDVDGIYTPSGTPFATWDFAYTIGTGSDRSLAVTKSLNGTPTIEYVFDGTDGSDEWTLTTNDVSVSPKDELRTETLKEQSASTTRREVSEKGVLASRVDTEWGTITLSSGDVTRLLSRTIDAPGLNLSTTYTYYDINDAAGKQGRIESVTYPDGSWIWYDYDSSGRTIQVIRPLGDNVLSGVPVANQNRVSEYDYTPHSTGDDGTRNPVSPRTVTEKEGGQIISKTFFVHENDSGAGATDIVERAASATATYGDVANLATITSYVVGDDEEVARVDYPDGRSVMYSRESGTFSFNSGDPISSSFTAGAGSDERTFVETVVTSTSTGVADKTTRSVSVTDSLGRQLKTETQVFTGGSAYDTIDKTVTVYDERGRVTDEYTLNGSHTETIWDCCGIDTVIASGGTETEYDRDVLGRVLSMTKKGVGASGTYAAQGDIVTVYSYDAMNRQTSVSVEDATATLSVTESTDYDLAGRVVQTTDPAQLDTAYLYELGGRKVTETAPGGFTTIQEYRRDGRMKSVTGTAIVHQYYDYGVDGSGNQYVLQEVGNVSSSRYTKTWTNVLGQQYLVERPAYPTGTVSATTHYEAGTGLIEKRTSTGQPAMLYDYATDVLWQVERTIVDLNGNESIDLASDRVAETLQDYYYDSGDSSWWMRTRSYVYPNDGDAATTVLVSESLQQLTGFSGGEISVSKSIDVNGNTTTTTVTENASTKLVTTTTDTPQSSANAVNIRRNGLLVSSTDLVGNETTYGYDGLAGQVTETDARGNTTTTVYDSSNGRVIRIETSDGASGIAQTSFTYNGTTGRRESITNALGKTTYMTYTDRGEVRTVYGDVPQPMKLGYNTFGERATLTTYRSEDFTTAWPSPEPSGDVTTWSFHYGTGLLTSKTDADGEAVTYTYESDGRIKTRTWARSPGGSGPGRTTYGYDADTNELLTITYSDGTTPNVTFTYDRLGRVKTVADGVGTHTYTYDASDLQLVSEEIGGTGSLYSKLITRNYSTTGVVGRYTGVSVGPDSVNWNADYDSAIGYDTFGRYQTFTGPGLPANNATYSYLADSNLIEKLEFKDGSTVVGGTTWGYESDRNLITSVDNYWMVSASPVNIAKFSYTNDTLGRRIDRVNDVPTAANDSFDAFSYNDRNELTWGSRFEGLDPQVASPVPVAGYDYSYTYDPIGNRIDGTAPNGEDVDYTSNNLNQYTGVTYPDIACELNEDSQFSHTNISAHDHFGYSVGQKGDWAIVGAPSKPGVFFQFIGVSGVPAGGAFQYVAATSGAAADDWGSAADVDGDVAVVGGPLADGSGGSDVDSGAIVVMRYASGSWSAEQRIDGANAGDRFGSAVAISGEMILVGAPYYDDGTYTDIGIVYVYRYDDTQPVGSRWVLDDTLDSSGFSGYTQADNDHFGAEVAAAGPFAMVGVPDHDQGSYTDTGAFQIFSYDASTTSWSFDFGLYTGIASDERWGAAVALTTDYAAVGTPGYSSDRGRVVVMRRSGAIGSHTWPGDASILPSVATTGDLFGSALRIEGDQILIGAPGKATGSGTPIGTGAAYLFKRVAVGYWDEKALLAPSNGTAGWSLADRYVGFDDGTATIGAIGAEVKDTQQFSPTYGQTLTDVGAAYRFDLSDTNLNNTPDRCEIVPTYDDDGNLLSDGRFNYDWDGENRLVKAEMIEAPDPYQAGPFWIYPPKLRVTYTYDYMGRRVRTFVEKNELFMAGVPFWETESDTRYMYDGWNVVLELDGEDSNAIVKKYTWGLDVSGSLQGVGGVGGVLACEDLKDVTDNNDDVQYVYAYGGNGNVMALTDSAQNQSTMAYDGTELARYDYDPYGNVLSATGVEADANRYRFSTKPQDAVTELFYYGYRWYHADWGRWISRDPIGERGGTNLIAFVGNNPTGKIDKLGQMGWNLYLLTLANGCKSYCGPDVTSYLAMLVNDTLRWRRGAGAVTTAEGTRWLKDNGMSLDWLSGSLSNMSCPKGPQCARTYWICGECVHDHWIGNFMYGFLAKLFHISDRMADTAAWWVQGPGVGDNPNVGYKDPPWDRAGYLIARNLADVIRNGENKTVTAGSLCQILKSDMALWDQANDTEAKPWLTQRYPTPRSKGYKGCKKCPFSLPKAAYIFPGGGLKGAWPPIKSAEFGLEPGETSWWPWSW